LDEIKIIEGVIIGATGGSLAGLTIWSVQFIHDKFSIWVGTKRIYSWMVRKTEDVEGKRFRSTRAIASWNNMTENRARFLCSNSSKIFLSTGEIEDRWSIYEHVRNK
jgi:hypothetical protein